MAATPSARRRALASLTAAAVAAAGVTAVVLTSQSAHGETISLPASGTITIHGNGNGHGHGMSQYGARGAAQAGLSATQIVQFYYPHTTLVTLPASTIRVWISRSGSYPTVAAASGLSVSGITGALATTGIAQYRLVPSGTGLALQKLGSASGSAWTTVKTGLASTTKFTSTQNFVRTYLSDGTSTSYRGSIGGVRSGSGVITVNYVGLDEYTEGVTPRESPASWPAAAVQAQAIAARTYGRNAVESHQSSSYDICDTSQCQEYGGMTHYDGAGHVLWTDDPAALSGNNNKVLQYSGATIFAQFSASDGGWTVDGGKPYLISQADPYDNPGSGDPYLDWVETPSVSSLANYYGLARATSIQITARDGHGDWGGRVLSAIVNGVDSGNTVQHISTTGFELQDALGLMTNWFGTTPPVLTPGAPTNVTAQPSDSSVIVRWSPPVSSGGSAVTAYVITFGSLTITTDGNARIAFAGPRVNGSKAVVAVRARNSAGLGPAVSVSATPVAQPQLLHPLPPTRLFDTRSPAVTVDPTHPFQFSVANKGGVPGVRARAVQLALTVVHPSASGVIRVHNVGPVALNTAAIAYQAGKNTSATITVPMFASYTIEFEASAGSVALIGDLMGYSGPGGGTVTAVGPSVVSSLASVPIGDGVAIPVRSIAGSSATGVLALVNARTLSASGYLRLWADGTAPAVSQVAVRPDGTNQNLVLVPIGADGSIHIGSSTSAIGATVTVVGVVGPATTATGNVETLPSVGTADPVRGTHALNVSSAPVTLPVLGTSMVPSSNVQLLVLHVTVSGASSAGTLSVYAAGSSAPATPTLTFSPGDAVSTTIAVRPGTNGAVTFVTSGATATVAVDTAGYVTT